MAVPRYDARVAHSLGGTFVPKLTSCPKCKCLEFDVVKHPQAKGLVLMQCTGCETIYVTIDRGQ